MEQSIYHDFKPSYKSFSFELKDAIMYVDLNRKQEMNSMNMTFFFDFLHFFKAINHSEKDIRCVILFSSAKHFSVGLDR